MEHHQHAKERSSLPCKRVSTYHTEEVSFSASFFFEMLSPQANRSLKSRFPQKLTLIAGLMIALAVGIWAASPTPLSPVAAAKLNPNAMPIDVNRGAAGLSRWLAALRTRASMLMITAHPDDEDGGMLAAETAARGARRLLTFNRGEGGQNAMSIDCTTNRAGAHAGTACRRTDITASINTGRGDRLRNFEDAAKRRLKSGATTACCPMWCAWCG